MNPTANSSGPHHPATSTGTTDAGPATHSSTTVAHATADATPRRRISWGAVFAGALLALITQLGLSLLGAGIGLSTIDPMEERNPLSGIGTGAVIWYALSTLVALYVGGLGAYLHLLGPIPVGLVARPGAALMAGPSAGAAWLNTAAVGDRLPVLGRQDIWYRVQWQQREAFVRAADLLVVE